MAAPLASREKRWIPVAAPALVGNERAYVLDCLDTTWISSNGSYIQRFEDAFAAFCGARHAVSCCNGTAALHAALLALGVGPGDEVIVPTLTFVATANAVTYCGARPVFVDSESATWNLDPALIEEKITPRTRGIIAVHLFGHPADMDAINEIARRRGLFVVEDAAEAHGALYKGRPVGTLGTVGVFSFFGNKIITAGEGGMIVTDDEALARKARQIKGQGQSFSRRYWFPIIGFNYRMTNIEAAIGLAQLEKADWHVGRRREVAGWYRELLAGIPGLQMQPEQPWARSACWMNTVVLPEGFPTSRARVMSALARRGVETRPVFYPMHTLPIYRRRARGLSFPVADALGARGANVPSGALLERDDVAYVCEALAKVVRGA